MASSIPLSYLKVPLQNGTGRYVGQLQRLLIRFCKSHPSSRGMRDFIENKLVDFTRANPGVVIYLKPRRMKVPLLTGTYLNGEVRSYPVAGKPVDEICQWFTHMNNVAGYKNHRLINRWHTDTPSIQGMWSPYLNKDPEMNITQFPSNSPKFKFKNRELSATEKILARAEQLRLEDEQDGTLIN